MRFQRPTDRLGLPLLALLGAGVVVLVVTVLVLQDGEPRLDGERATRITAAGPGAPAPELPQPRPERAAVPPPERSHPAPEPPRLGPAAIIGRVLDEATGEPVGAFQVNVLPHGDGSPLDRLGESPPEPFHRRTGVFRIERQPGLWDVVVRAPEFEPLAVSAIETPAVDGKPVPFALRRGPGIVGTVYGGDNLAVPDIKVFLHVVGLDDPDARPPRLGVAQTAKDGRFSFAPLPRGEYAVSLLELDNTVDRVGGIRVHDGTTTITLYLQPRHQVQLKVGNAHGRPVAAAQVELRSSDHFASGSSNENGIVILDHVPDGEFQLRVQRRGFREHAETLELIGGSGHQVLWVTLEREP